MFEQSPSIGPGAGTVTEHSAEILVLMGGAFLLGMLLNWLWSRRLVLQLRQTAAELTRTKERLVAAERRPLPTARLRESSSTEHERTLTQLRESREAEAQARKRLVLLESQLAQLQTPQTAATPPEQMEAILPFAGAVDPKPRLKR